MNYFFGFNIDQSDETGFIALQKNGCVSPSRKLGTGFLAYKKIVKSQKVNNYGTDSFRNDTQNPLQKAGGVK